MEKHIELHAARKNWFGDNFPEEWHLFRMRFLVKNVVVQVNNKDADEIYVELENIEKGTGKLLPIEDEKPFDSSVKCFKKGDLLFGRLRPYLAKAWLADKKGVCVGELLVFEIDHTKADARFLLYRILSAEFISYVDSATAGAKMPRVGWPFIADIQIPVPEVNLQKTITQFLDHKTALIDQYIANKQKQIQLLEQLRTSIISEAVTRGLDPDVEMKDLGTEWIIKIPKKWKLVQFSHYVDFQEGPGIMASDFRLEGIPLLRIANLQQDEVDLDGCNFLDRDMVANKWKHFQLNKDDILISCSASTGLVSEVKENAVGAIPYTGLVRLRPKNKEISREFIKLFVSSNIFFSQIAIFQTGSTIQHFGPTHLRRMRVPLPGYREQIAIVNSVTNSLKQILGTTIALKEQITKIEAYRSALISEAVTGKIDVSNFTLPSAESLA